MAQGQTNEQLKESIKALKRANDKLSKDVAKLTEALKQSMNNAETSKRSILTGRGIGAGLRNTAIRAGSGATVRDFRQGGLLGVGMGAVGQGVNMAAGIAMRTGIQAARTWTQNKAINSDIYLTDAQKQAKTIGNFAGMFGLGGLWQDKLNTSGLQEKLDKEAGTVGILQQSLTAQRMQGLNPSMGQIQQETEAARAASSIAVQSKKDAGQYGGTPGLNKEVQAALKAMLDEMKNTVVTWAKQQGSAVLDYGMSRQNPVYAYGEKFGERLVDDPFGFFFNTPMDYNIDKWARGR